MSKVPRIGHALDDSRERDKSHGLDDGATSSVRSLSPFAGRGLG
jgi:hypothetical protein